jgi:hypothetical protein
MIPPKCSRSWPNVVLTFGLAAPLSLLGCTSDEIDNGDEQAADETEGDGDGGDGDGEVAWVAARGIQILEVEANQGTAVLIGKDGEWVGAQGRNAYMIRDRDTLVRLQHTVDPNWIPREIRGVLHIRDAEGNELPPRIRQIQIEGPSDPKNLNTNFYFSVLAEEAQPGTS